MYVKISKNNEIKLVTVMELSKLHSETDDRRDATRTVSQISRDTNASDIVEISCYFSFSMIFCNLVLKNKKELIAGISKILGL